MKQLLCVTLVAALTATSCSSAKKDAGRPSGAVDPSLKTKLVFALPDISKLTAGEKLASSVMTHYLFSIKEVEGSCIGVDKTHKALSLEQVNAIDSTNLAATVPANCDYSVQLSLGAKVDSSTALADKVTYSDSLKPIVDLKCTKCHGGSSPDAGIDLSTLTGVTTNKSSMASSVSGGSMPPKSSPQLTTSEKAAFKAWQSGGYAMGDDTTPSTSTADDSTDNAPSVGESLDNVYYWNKTPLEISKADLQKFKTFSAVIVLALTSEGKAAGFTVGSLKTIEEKSVSNDPAAKTKSEDTSDEISTKTSTTTTAATVSYADVKGIITKNCVTCHPNAKQSDLSTYAAFMKRSDASLLRIIAGTMPTAGPLSASDVALMKKWRDAGYPEKAASGTATTPTTTTKPTTPTADATGLVEFHIPAGTGSKPWNSPSNPLKLKVGQKLKIINDDSQPHWLHTDGQPCGHGTNMAANGGSYVCSTTRAYSGDLHDHLHDQSGFFYIEVTK